jgi:hypothetical protein
VLFGPTEVPLVAVQRVALALECLGPQRIERLYWDLELTWTDFCLAMDFLVRHGSIMIWQIDSCGFVAVYRSEAQFHRWQANLEGQNWDLPFH